jgi:uncharacterized repeat protein (TIGR01451 family)
MQKTLLDVAMNYLYADLQNLATGNSFDSILRQALGENIDSATAEAIRLQWSAGDFSQIPQVEILPNSTLGEAQGAYSQTTNTFYLSEDFLNTSPSEEIVSVLLEETGHWLDSQLNISDTLGDEGEIFSGLVKGKIFSYDELEKIAAENDTATIFVNGQNILIEQATISDSGGFEGSRETVKLDAKGGGTVKFNYQFFTIPDQFIIRYEGKELINTGFVGGGKSGQIQIPQGNSDTLEVIVATNDAGTAWEYTVTTDSCPDVQPFVLELVGGQFQDADKDGDCEGTGTIIIGRKDGIAQMFKVDGTVEYTKDKITVNGIVTSLIGVGRVKSDPLFQGTFEIDPKTGKASVKETGALPNEYTLGGLPVDFEGITINRNGLALGAKFELLDEIGFPDFVFNGSDALLISQNNVGLGTSVKFSLPTFKDFNFFNFLPVKEFSNASLEYVAPEDRLKIQGKLSIGNDFTKAIKLETITADFSGENAIEIQGGQVDVKGSLAVKTDIDLVGGWGLKEVKLNIDTKKKDVGGSAKVEFPLKFSVPPGDSSLSAELGFKLPIPPLELNKVGIDVDNLNIPVPKFPLLFFQGFSGSVENLATSDSDPIEFAGGVKGSLGPKLDVPGVGTTALIAFELSGKFSTDEVSGTGKSFILSETILKSEGTNTINFKDKFFETKGSLEILDGSIKTNSSFKATSSYNIKSSGAATASIPKSVPLFGGAQLGSATYLLDFSNDNNLANDFAAAWGIITIQKLGLNVQAVAGFKGFFDGRTERIGAKNIPPTSSFAIEPSTEWVLLSADWQNPITGDVPIQIKTPDGRTISEADFTANNIAIVEELTDENTKTVILAAPQAGIWDIEVVDPTNLGSIEYTAATDSVLPTIDVTAPAVDVGGGTVEIGYDVFDADSVAEVQLFYDNDNQGFDGIPIVEDLLENDGSGSFSWNVQGIPTGEYFIYAMVMDENNPPAFDYSQGRVILTEEADISVAQVANQSAIVGENLTYNITVTNNGSIESQGVTLTEALSEDVTFVSASVPPSQQTGNTLAFDLGNLAAGESRTFEIITTLPATVGTIESTAIISSLTFDPDATNDVDNQTTFVEDAPSPVSDLTITRVDKGGAIDLGQEYTYTLTIANNGPNDATGVVLRENLPSVTDTVSQILSQGNAAFDPSTQVLTANLDTIKSGESATVEVTVKPFAAGDLVTTSLAESTTIEANPADNELIAVNTVNSTLPAPADLELTQTVDNPKPELGQNVTFTITLSNKGPGSATGIEVTDKLPSELTFISATPEQGTYDPTTGIWNVGNVRDNLARTLTITARADIAASSLSNIAEVTAVGETDPDSTPNNNNSAEDDFAAVSFTTGIKEIIGTSKFDILVGTDEAERLIGLEKPDLLTGGGGNDQFAYTSTKDFGDLITDFAIGEDKIVLTQILDSFNYQGSDPIADGFVRFWGCNKGTIVGLDSDGFSGNKLAKSFIIVKDASAVDLNNPNNFIF